MAILYKTGIFANYPIETVGPNVASSDFGLSGHGPMAFLAPTFWTASCFGLSVLGLRLFGLWSV